MCCASSRGQRVCKPRLEEANTGVGGAKPRSPAHAGFHFMLLFKHLFMKKECLFSPLFAREVLDEV